MRLDSILEVAGMSKRITIANALRVKSACYEGRAEFGSLRIHTGGDPGRDWETPVNVDEAVLDAVAEAIEDDSGIAARTSMVSIEATWSYC